MGFCKLSRCPFRLICICCRLSLVTCCLSLLRSLSLSSFLSRESRSNAVTELVESLCKPSAESNLFELSRGEAKDIKVPSIDYAESQKKYSRAQSNVESRNRWIVKSFTDARAVRPYFVQPAMRVVMWGGRSFYRPCAALRLLKTCLQIGLTLYEGNCAHLALKFLIPHS